MSIVTKQSLRSIFLGNLEKHPCNPIEKLVADILVNKAIDLSLETRIKEICATGYFENEELSPLGQIGLQANQAALYFLLYLLGDSKVKSMNPPFSKNNDSVHWKGVQIAEALRALEAFVEGRHYEAIAPHQLQGGAAPFEYRGHWSWASVPHQRYHSFLGVLWCVLGVLGHHENLIKAAEKLAFWQLNTLDSAFNPHYSLFSQEEDVFFGEALAWNSLLFKMVGSFSNKPEMTYASRRQLELLNEVSSLDKAIIIPPLAVVIEEWLLSQKTSPNEETFVLDGNVCDESTALIGCRGTDYSFKCTVYGGGTGLGAVRYKDLEIVTYGPQYRPYGDCKGFGIEASFLSQKKFPNLEISQRKDGFTLKGIAKLPGKVIHASPYALFRSTSHSESWIDIIQSCENGVLNIETLFLGLDNFDSLSFAFYVKGSQCCVEGRECINPRTLDRYKGPLAPLTLTSQGAKMSIIPKYQHGVMEIIPLAGDDSFWGADFLVGYSVSKQFPKYHWTVSLS